MESLGVQVRPHHRQIDPSYEYDITVPDKKIAIEFNGLYWHSESFKPKNYHRDKTRAAERAGWRVIHVWEDDWRDRRSVVERMLARKIGVSTEPRVNARETQVQSVSVKEANEFLETNHIQGASRGSVRYGLFWGDRLVAIAVFLHRDVSGSWELVRYATDSLVRGGFSKLIHHFEKEHSPREIVTFSENTISDGGLYESTGFVRDKEITPDYHYVVAGKRVHKFNYRLKRFRSDPGLEYRDGLTERELSELNGLKRIYDAGKVRWVFSL